MLFSMFVYNVSQILQIEKISWTTKRCMNKIIRLLIVGLEELNKESGPVEAVSPIHSAHSGARTVNKVARYDNT